MTTGGMENRMDRGVEDFFYKDASGNRIQTMTGIKQIRNRWQRWRTSEGGWRRMWVEIFETTTVEYMQRRGNKKRWRHRKIETEEAQELWRYWLVAQI